MLAGWYWLRLTRVDGMVILSTKRPGSCRRKFLRRLRQPLPLIYFVIVVLSLVGGSIYQPWSFDAVTYRLPRLLIWWADRHWHWIGTLDHRLDFSSCGYEWQMLPIIELTHSDRALFLLNWIPYLLMPGLIFLAFRMLGASGPDRAPMDVAASVRLLFRPPGEQHPE